MRVICRIEARNDERYLRYAVACAWSLVRNGGVPAGDIFVETSALKTSSKDVAELLRMGVRVVEYDGFSRLAGVERLMVREGADRVIQVDSDCYLAERLDLCDFASRSDGGRCWCHRCETPPSYAAKLEYGLSVMPRVAMPREWVSYLLTRFGVDESEFGRAMAREPIWTWGSFYVIGRELLGSRYWRAASCFNQFLTADDEMSCLWAESVDPRLGFIEVFPQVIVRAGELRSAVGRGRGLLHYAGNESKAGNAAAVEGLYRSAVGSRPTWMA